MEWTHGCPLLRGGGWQEMQAQMPGMLLHPPPQEPRSRKAPLLSNHDTAAPLKLWRLYPCPARRDMTGDPCRQERRRQQEETPTQHQHKPAPQEAQACRPLQYWYPSSAPPSQPTAVAPADQAPGSPQWLLLTTVVSRPPVGHSDLFQHVTRLWLLIFSVIHFPYLFLEWQPSELCS